MLARYDADRSGALDLEEFKTLVYELRRFQAGRDPTEARKQFARFDRNRDGAIDAAELRDALNALGLATDSAQAADVLRQYDADRSGRLELAEFEKLVAELRRYQGVGADTGMRLELSLQQGGYVARSTLGAAEFWEEVRSVFVAHALESSGRMSVGALRAALVVLGLPTSSAQAAAVLAKFDADTSGDLDLGEFRKLCAELRRFLSASAPTDPPPQSSRPDEAPLHGGPVGLPRTHQSAAPYASLRPL